MSKILGPWCLPHVCNIFATWLFLPGGNWLKKAGVASGFIFEDSKGEGS